MDFPMFIYLKKFNTKKIKYYLIGGSIRDKLLLSSFIEKDWLLLKSKFNSIYDFKLVGKSFPVFLNPINKEEHSLAREYGLIYKKYNKIFFKFSYFANLQNDLLNRDLTINTLVLSRNGFVIDKLTGILDLKKKKLSYTSFFLVSIL